MWHVKLNAWLYLLFLKPSEATFITKNICQFWARAKVAFTIFSMDFLLITLCRTWMGEKLYAAIWLFSILLTNNLHTDTWLMSFLTFYDCWIIAEVTVLRIVSMSRIIQRGSRKVTGQRRWLFGAQLFLFILVQCLTLLLFFLLVEGKRTEQESST